MTGRSCKQVFFVVTLSSMAAPAAQAAIINVPADHATIQAAINAAVDTDEIVVAPGTYVESINFLGKAITLRGSDGPDVTIIDATGLNDHVVTCASSEGPSTVLVGFTLTGAYLIGSGGGMYNVNSSPTVNNCIFLANVVNVPNPAGVGYGGGMSNSNSNPTVTNCIFRQNKVVGWGGGGGMFNSSSSNPAVTNCTFFENDAVNALSGGGGMLNSNDSNPTVTNCILWNNVDASGVGQAAQIRGPAVVNYSLVQGGWTGMGGVGNINADPLFVDPDGPDNIAGTQDDNLRLMPGSPAIDAGDNTAVTVPTDLDGNPRFAGGTVDMGAYEWAALLADPSGSDKNRFLSFVVPSGVAAGAGVETAIQIELTTLNHVCSPESDNLFEPCNIDDDCTNGVCDQPFASSEGGLRYVNTIKTCQGGAMSTGEVICRSLDDCAVDEECLQFRTCDGTTDLCATGDDCPAGVPCLASMSCPDDVFKPPFLCATTGCEPEYRDWASDLAGGVLHVYGPGIVPARSEYNLRQIPAACAGNEASCASASDALMITTARWADLTTDGATNAQDITAASDKVKPIPEALTKPRTMLIPGILNPFRNVNVTELQNTVDAVKSLPMPGSIAGPEDCGG